MSVGGGLMHFLIGLAIVTGLIAFAFSEDVARGFLQGLLVLLFLAGILLLWDFYREIPLKKPDRYKVLELEFEPKKTYNAETWIFK
jgi:hypothetical protein